MQRKIKNCCVFDNHRDKLAKKRPNVNSIAPSIEIEVGLAPLEFKKIVFLVVFGCALPANLFKVDQRSLFVQFFMKKAEF